MHNENVIESRIEEEEEWVMILETQGSFKPWKVLNPG